MNTHAMCGNEREYLSGWLAADDTSNLSSVRERILYFCYENITGNIMRQNIRQIIFKQNEIKNKVNKKWYK